MAMTDAELESLYKAALGTSHAAGLRAVYEAGARDLLIQLGSAPTPPDTTPPSEEKVDG